MGVPKRIVFFIAKLSILNKIILLCFLFAIFLVALVINNLNSYQIKSGPEMNIKRAYHQSILLDNENVLIAGGVNKTNNETFGLKSAEIFNTKENKFVKISDMNLPHVYHSALKMKNGNIVIADINGIEIFDTKTNKFNLLKTKPKYRFPEFRQYKFELLPNDKLVIIGGRIETKNGKQRNLRNLNQIEIIDLNNDKLVKTINFEGNRFGTTLLKNGDLLIVGGKIVYKNKEFLSNEVFVLDSKKLQLKHLANLKHGVQNPFVFSNNDNVVVLGGENLFYYQDNYIIPKSQTYIEILDLKKHKTKEINISKILKYNEGFLLKILTCLINNENTELLKDEPYSYIMDIVPFVKKDCYLLALREYASDSKIILMDFSNINKIKIHKVNKPFLPPYMFNTSFTTLKNEVMVSGGQVFFNDNRWLDGIGPYLEVFQATINSDVSNKSYLITKKGFTKWA